MNWGDWLAFGRRQGRAEALTEAADEVRRIRENGLDPHMESHPTSELFEQWLRDRAKPYLRDEQ